MKGEGLKSEGGSTRRKKLLASASQYASSRCYSSIAQADFAVGLPFTLHPSPFTFHATAWTSFSGGTPKPKTALPISARELTAKGHKQAAEMAQWLSRRLPKDTRILVSPAVRAQQTARRTDAMSSRPSRKSSRALRTQRSSRPPAGPSHKGAVLVVGHQPTLGQTGGVADVRRRRRIGTSRRARSGGSHTGSVAIRARSCCAR